MCPTGLLTDREAFWLIRRAGPHLMCVWLNKTLHWDKQSSGLHDYTCNGKKNGIWTFAQVLADVLSVS